MRTSTVFRSRWMALLWAAGIIWLALDYTSPDNQSTGNGQAVANQTPDTAD